MAKELEIKLSLSDEHSLPGWEWLVAQREACPGKSQHLRNVYYDTPDGLLNQRKVALRVRRAESQFIQTLKTQGEFVEGVHRRNEWEWPVGEASLDLKRIEGLPALQDVDLNTLKPAFETNFTRRIVTLGYGDTEIEVAFDSGQIVAGGHQQALNEIEFELKKGEPAQLLRWAAGLSQAVPVFLNVISKAEQGYHLGGVLSPEPNASGTLSVHDFLSCLSACWLWRMPFPLEGADLSGIERMAAAAGVSADFQALARQLSSGQPVNELIKDGCLGRFQLALAGPTPA